MNAVSSEAEGADTLKLLLEKGANPNAEMTEGERALDWALYKGDRAKIRMLEQHGATRGRGPRRDEIAPPQCAGVVDSLTPRSAGVSTRLMEVAPKFRDQAGMHFLPSQRHAGYRRGRSQAERDRGR